MAKVQREKSQSKTDSSKSSGKGNSGNFKENPERAAEAGRKGGSNSHGGGRKS
jgi:general stress protein YciG